MIAHQPNTDIERFDRWSKTYENSPLQNWLFDRVHRGIIQIAAQVLSTEPTVIADIGCGTGRLLRAVARRWPNARLIGVDPAEGMIEIAKRLYPEATFYVGTAEALPLPSYSVDLALSTLSFHHWQDHAAALHEIARVLRPGGYFILGDISTPGWLARIIKHANALNQESMFRLFRNAGLEVEGEQPLYTDFVKATIGKRPLIQ